MPTTYEPVIYDFLQTQETLEENSPEVAEALSLVETSSPSGTWNVSNADSMLVLDVPKPGWTLTIADALTLAESIIPEVSVLIQELVQLADELVVDGTYTVSIEDVLSLIDKAIQGKLFIDTLADTVNLAESVTLDPGIIKQVLEHISLQESWLVNASTNLVIKEALSVIDVLYRSWEKSIADSLSTAETLIATRVLGLAISDALSVVLDPSPGHIAIQTLEDSFSLTDLPSNTASLFLQIEDDFSIKTKIILDGEVYQCWVLSTERLGASVYSNFDFNSFALVQDQLYGAKEDGIYTISGSDDAGQTIHPGVVLNLRDLGDVRTKRFRAAYLGASGSRIVLKVEADNKTKYYAVSDKKTTIHRDQEGKNWIFSLTGLDELRNAEFYPVILVRDHK